MLVSHISPHFGTLKSNVQWCKIKQESEESEEFKLLNNILSGERQVWMELVKPLPSYASIDGTNVEVAWKEILNAMGYTEWKGGETVVENSESGEHEDLLQQKKSHLLKAAMVWSLIILRKPQP